MVTDISELERRIQALEGRSLETQQRVRQVAEAQVEMVRVMQHAQSVIGRDVNELKQRLQEIASREVR